MLRKKQVVIVVLGIFLALAGGVSSLPAQGRQAGEAAEAQGAAGEEANVTADATETPGEGGDDPVEATDCMNKVDSLVLAFSDAEVSVGIFVLEAGAQVSFKNNSSLTTCEVSASPAGILWEESFSVLPFEERQTFTAREVAEPLVGDILISCGEAKGNQMLVVCP
ncbi:hypothetical protein ACUUL3_12440 [Thiovibrio sp. JS02]